MLLFALTAVLATSLFIDDYLFFHANSQWFYFNGKPLLTAADGYYFLGLAEDILQGESMLPLLHTPLLSVMTAWISLLTGVGIDFIAYYLPPVFALSGMGIFLLWGRRFYGPDMVAVSAAMLFGMTGMYHHARTNLGYFDTDCLNVSMVYAIAYTALRFARGETSARFMHAGLFAALCVFFFLWWRSASVIVITSFVFAYAASLFIPTGRIERGAKAAMLAMFAVVGLLFMFEDELGAPDWLRYQMSVVQGHFELVTHVQTEDAPLVADSIGELFHLNPELVVTVTTDSAPTFAAALIGMLCLLWTRRRNILFYAPLLGLMALSFLSNRFVLFMIPFLGFGVGWLTHVGLRAADELENRRREAKAAVAVGALLLCAPNLYAGYTLQTPPMFSLPEAKLAEVIRSDVRGREFSPGNEPRFWSWWDYGYMAEYFSGIPSFFHGGSQDPYNTFIAAYGLTLSDPTAAANWIRYFLNYGSRGLHEIIALTGDKNAAVRFLTEAFADRSRVNDVIARYGLQGRPDLAVFLFPQRRCYLYLPLRIIDKSSWIYYFGSWDFERVTGRRPLFEPVPTAEAQIDKRNFKLTRRGETFDLAVIAEATRRGVGLGRGPQNADKALVIVEGAPYLFLLDRAYMDTIMYRLLFQAPYATPGFTPVEHHSWFGGVWALE